MPLDIEVGQLWESRRKENAGKVYRVTVTDIDWEAFWPSRYVTLEPTSGGRRTMLTARTLRERYRRLEGQAEPREDQRCEEEEQALSAFADAEMGIEPGLEDVGCK